MIHTASGKKLIDKTVYINKGEGKVSAGKYTIVCKFFSNYKPTNINDCFALKVMGIGEYERDGSIEKVYSKQAGPYVLEYPYFNDEYQPTGWVEYLNLN